MKFAQREIGYRLDFVGVSVEGVEFERLNGNVVELFGTVANTLHGSFDLGSIAAIFVGLEDD
ncbi:hypothetical protein AY599_16815 [Leptolyngbya valderiana BDU 20041]|nr:hypothetical protein AY599_16815 [Leptolyngbya valderiana BDU 20041]